MDIKDFFRKVDKNKLKDALSSDDPNALKNLAGDDLDELTPEQLDYVAGGIWDEDSSCTSV
ncbi:MAG: hypothetical protein IKO68_06685 [Oscillospiraceae bacterium]|nr:hypothetical protein [Oscillospiraceae bacterium]MBR7190266.1 hypothetical protein [Oscillospiraceae bacterium]